jgi:hypothetical protein
MCLVDGEIGDELLEPSIFVLDLPQSSQLTDAQVGELLLPEVERRLANAELSTDIAGRRAALGLAQRVRDLLLGELRALHGPLPL